MKSHLITSCNTSSLQKDYECEKAFDGDVTDRTGWAFNGHLPSYIVVNFETPVTINVVAFKNDHTYSIREFSVEVGIAGHFSYIKNVSGPYSPKIEGDRIEYNTSVWGIRLSFDQEEDITSVRITVHSINPTTTNGMMTELYVLHVEDEVEFVDHTIDNNMRNIQEGTQILFINISDFTFCYRVSKICYILKCHSIIRWL